LLQLCS